MKITKKQIQEAINKGWVFYGEFSPEVATEEVMKLLAQIAPKKVKSKE